MESLEEKVDVGVARRSADFSKRNIIRCYRFFKRNVDYLLSDGFAMGAGWSAGGLTTFAMDYVDAPDWQNAILTSAVKSGVFIIAKVSSQRDEKKKVLQSSIESTVGKSLADAFVHYTVKSATDLGPTASFVSAYLSTGLLATGYRYIRDYRNGVMK